VAASVLESLALGVPVLASQNGHRPASVVTYGDGDAADLCAGMIAITESRSRTNEKPDFQDADDNIAKAADCLLAHARGYRQGPGKSLVHAQ